MSIEYWSLINFMAFGQMYFFRVVQLLKLSIDCNQNFCTENLTLNLDGKTMQKIIRF